MIALAACANGDPRADRKNPPEGSPEAAALRSWGYYKTSTWPVLAAAYHPRVLRSLGSSDVMDALTVAGGSLQDAPTIDVKSKPTTLGSFVTLRVRYQDKPYAITYLMVRSGGRWRIAYDTLLANALPTYVQARIADLTGKRGKDPSQQAVNAGQEAARLYRRIFAPPPRDGRIFDKAISRSGVELPAR